MIMKINQNFHSNNFDLNCWRCCLRRFCWRHWSEILVSSDRLAGLLWVLRSPLRTSPFGPNLRIWRSSWSFYFRHSYFFFVGSWCTLVPSGTRSCPAGRLPGLSRFCRSQFGFGLWSLKRSGTSTSFPPFPFWGSEGCRPETRSVPIVWSGSLFPVVLFAAWTVCSVCWSSSCSRCCCSCCRHPSSGSDG